MRTLLLVVTWACISAASLRAFGTAAIPTVFGLAGAASGFSEACKLRISHFMPIAAPFIAFSLCSMLFLDANQARDVSVMLLFAIGLPCCIALLAWLHLELGNTKV